jgi:hypothetical protein
MNASAAAGKCVLSLQPPPELSGGLGPRGSYTTSARRWHMPVPRQRHCTRQRHVAAIYQSHSRDGIAGRATRGGRDQGRPVAGAASDAMDAGGLNGFGQGHRR